MTKALLRITLVLLFGTGLILLAEHFDARYQANLLDRQTAQHLEQVRHSLQQQFDQLIDNHEQLAHELAADQALLNHLPQHPIIRDIGTDPAELTLSFTREYQVVAAFPVIGSEAVMGINYFLSPEFMISIRRALDSGGTVMDSNAVLRQTNQQGIILRTPYFSDSGQFLGLVQSAADLQILLRKAGWNREEADFDLLIEARSAQHSNLSILGQAEDFRRSADGVRVTIPEDGYWELRARQHSPGYSTVRSDVIRLSGAALMALLIFHQLYRSGILAEARGNNRYGITLHTSVLLMVILPIAVLVGIIAWLSFSATQQAAERLMQQQASELARQLRARIEAFFDVPRQAAFDVELFRNGVLDPQQPEQMLSIFLSQLRVQPQLTFLSMANAQGEYYAASRPPTGSDRNVRLHFATLATHREMRLHWVGEGNRPSEQFIRGNPNFDARNTVWYQQAIEQPGLRWYPVYRYTTQDARNQYQGFGIGVSSAVYDADNRFLGVITADVALQQLSDFLKRQAGDLSRIIFLAEENGSLLASSDDSRVFRLEQGRDVRISMHDSQNPLIRAAGAAITQEQQGAGNRFIQVDRTPHLLDWQTIRLPDGPSVLIAIVLPQSWVSSTAAPVLRNVLYLTALFLSMGILAVLFLLSWLTRPLLRLEVWARQLGRGNWQATLPPASAIREINSLSHSLGAMAGQLRGHAEELEQRVADRTHELAIVNQKLAELSFTDALTGVANRRRFDEFIQREWQRSRRSGDSLALLMLDVDNFKSYNDHYGHAAGDQALIKVAQALNQQVRRAGDLLCRYGGEEFAAVLTDTDLAAALALAEKQRAAVSALKIEHCHTEGGYLTISIGVTAGIPQVDTRLQAFFAAADSALYQAKREGRNRVCGSG